MSEEGAPDWEALVGALLTRDVARLLRGVSAPANVLDYGRRWLDLVAQELRAEVWESAQSLRGRAARRNRLEYTLALRQLVADGNAWAAELRLGGEEGEAAAKERARRENQPVPVLKGDVDEGGEAPMTFQILYAHDNDLLFFVGRPVADLPGHFRVVPFNVDSFAVALGTPEAGSRVSCSAIGTSLAALYRADAISKLDRLAPSLRNSLIPGETCKVAATRPWLPLSDNDLTGLKLNKGQLAALKGMDGPLAIVQGPPGTGKSSFITEVFLRRIPRDAKVLACTSTNKAIDSLVSKFEAAGVTEIVVVGSKERVGEVSQKYLLSARLATEARVSKAVKALAKAENVRECAEEKVASAKKPKNPKKDAVTGKEDNRGFVERQLQKLSKDTKEAKKTPGVVRLMGIVGAGDAGRITNKELFAKAQEYLSRPASGEDAAALEELREAKRELRAALSREETAIVEVARQQSTARARVMRSARFVACTASSAVHVTKRLVRSLEIDEDEEEQGDKAAAACAEQMRFPYVILDEAGAMLEPDAVGTLLHGAEALLLVGDHYQLPPFSKWREADRTRYNVSLMERLATPSGRSSAGYGRNSRENSHPVWMLEEQYRMHPAIGRAVSVGFYDGKLQTAASCATARKHPLPLNWVEAGGAEAKPEGASSFVNDVEASCVVRIVGAFARHGGHPQASINVLTFYNAQRSLIAKKLNGEGLRDVAVISVDAMQGREVDVVVLSCVRSEPGGAGFLADWRRVNVAVSRARECLVVVGTDASLRGARAWQPVLREMRRHADDAAFRQAYALEVSAGSAVPRDGPRAKSVAAVAVAELSIEAEAAAEAAAREVPDDWENESNEAEAQPTAPGSDVADVAECASKDVAPDEDGFDKEKIERNDSNDQEKDRTQKTEKANKEEQNGNDETRGKKEAKEKKHKGEKKEKKEKEEKEKKGNKEKKEKKDKKEKKEKKAKANKSDHDSDSSG